MMGRPETQPFYGVAGILVFLLCGYLAQMKVNRWRKAQGIAPAPSITRTGNREYKKWLWQSMPTQIQKQFWGLIMVGFATATIGLWLAA